MTETDDTVSGYTAEQVEALNRDHEEQQRLRVHLDWKRRQAIEMPLPTLLAPTIPQRINRLNPQERTELGRLIRSMKLRKIIRRTLAEAFWQGEERRAHAAALDHATRRFTRGVADAYDRADSFFNNKEIV